MYRSSPFRSTMNTNVITALGMRKVCTEAVHSVALWTRTLSQLWACVRYVPKQSIRSTMNTNVITALGMCKVCTEAVHSVARKRQDWTCESTCEHENAKTRKRENGRNQPVDAKTAKTRKRRKQENRENGENAKTRKPENAKTAKTTKTRKRPKVFLFSGFQFLVFWFSRFSRFSGFLVFWFSRSASRTLLARSRFLCA